MEASVAASVLTLASVCMCIQVWWEGVAVIQTVWVGGWGSGEDTASFLPYAAIGPVLPLAPTPLLRMHQLQGHFHVL